MHKKHLVLATLIFLTLASCITPSSNLPVPPEATEQVEVTLTQTNLAGIQPSDTPEPEIPASPTIDLVTETHLPADLSPILPASSTPEPANSSVLAPARYTRSGNPIVVDHTSVELFEQIPDEYLEAARNIQVMFADRSVGANIDQGLDCLTAPSWSSAPANCRVDYIGSNWEFKSFTSDAPASITFDPDPVKYNRTNWIFEAHTGEWPKLTDDFVNNLAPKHIETADVLSYQFTYLNVDERSDIADPEKGFFADNPNKYDIYDLEAFMAQHPDKTFPFWTTSLARAIGSPVSNEFNDQIRKYAKERNLVLFDVADIEAHTDKGEPCYDNRDGVEYCTQQGKCENYPDDGLDLLAICQDYTTETDGGHLGSVSGGKIRIVKAFWVLMAQIAGWVP